MLKKFVPFAHALNIYEVSVDFYIKNNIKVILCDLDNTLDAYNVFSPSEKAHELVKKIQENNIDFYIISNNHGKRVKKYASELGVKCVFGARKPFAFKVKKFLKQMKIKKENVIIIGDQTVTDIACANGAKIKSILTDKLVEIDQPTTRFNRFFDKRIRKRLLKKNLLIDWRNYLWVFSKKS